MRSLVNAPKALRSKYFRQVRTLPKRIRIYSFASGKRTGEPMGSPAPFLFEGRSVRRDAAGYIAALLPSSLGNHRFLLAPSFGGVRGIRQTAANTSPVSFLLTPL